LVKVGNTKKPKAVLKAVVNSKRKSMRDIYIDEHKDEINQAIQAAGNPTPAAFQLYVTSQLKDLTAPQIAVYEAKAADHFAASQQLAKDLDPDSLSQCVFCLLGWNRSLIELVQEKR
jgi:hypothetical protein